MQAHAEVVKEVVSLAAAAMQWPDAHSQLRAVAACRAVAAAAGAPLNPVSVVPGTAAPGAEPLQALLVPCILRATVLALAVVNEGHAASEMLLLVRSVYIVCAQWQPSSIEMLRSLLPNAPQSHFEEVWPVNNAATRGLCFACTCAHVDGPGWHCRPLTRITWRCGWHLDV